MKKHNLVIATSEKDIFKAIKNGKKKVETRAATFRYQNIQVGDVAAFSCGAEKIEKQITKVTYFKSPEALLKVYYPEDIHPGLHSAAELNALWNSFSGYKKKIAEFGLVAMELG